MCGFNGIFSPGGFNEQEREAFLSSSSVLAHRGPDDSGSFSGPSLMINHRRLAIIDLSQAAHQPMWDESGRYLLAYNGECYNFRELRTELKGKDLTFQSDSDTEVVLKLLISDGPEALKRINGFFALAFYDTKENVLILARDERGIKPLYMHRSGDRIIFSSELRGITELKPKLSLNHRALLAYLHLNYIPSPHSIFNEVQKVEGGTFCRIGAGEKMEVSSYPVAGEIRQKLNSDPESSFLEILESSVKRRLVADVAVGSFLSGGLDSSLLTAMAARHKSDLRTFTVVFNQSDQYNEARDAATVAQHLGTDHCEVEISEKQLLEGIPEILKEIDEPFADSSAIAMNELCRAAGREITVALSGDGGDELFAGYLKHRALLASFTIPQPASALKGLNLVLRKVPSGRQKGLANMARMAERYTRAAGQDALNRYWTWAGYGGPSLMEGELTETDIIRFTRTGISDFSDGLRADLNMVLEGDMLVKTDRYSMRHGLEVRLPMLDREMVEFAWGLDTKYKINLRRGKILLRNAASRILPASIANKKKHGFEVPLKKWLNSDLRNLASELLDDELVADQGIFDLKKVREVRSGLSSTNSNNAEYAAWNLMVFNSWWLRHREILTP